LHPGLTVAAINTLYFSKAPQANVVVILGGTNDLYRDANASKIIEDLIELHNRVKLYFRDAGVQPVATVAVTIPRLPNAGPDIERRRRSVNEAIREYARATTSLPTSHSGATTTAATAGATTSIITKASVLHANTTWLFDMDTHWPGSPGYISPPHSALHHQHQQQGRKSDAASKGNRSTTYPLTASSPSLSSKDMWGADMVHFSPQGYDAMGAGIYECIKNNYAKMRLAAMPTT
jgi:lysophospholipase L1-like esterase